MKYMNDFCNRTLHILLSIAMLFFCGYAAAQDNEEDAKTLSPYFVVLSDNPEVDMLPLKKTSADVNIVGVIADVTIKQQYVNSGKNTLEAIYTFPMSTKAAVYAMKMTIGKRTITAKIDEKNKARKDYEKAKSEGKRASLLEQSRPNVFTMNVANIAVNDTIVVELKYTELLIPEKGVYSFVYPTVVGPRYSNKNKQKASSNDAFVNSPYTKSGTLPAYNFGFAMKIQSGLPIQDVSCNTHKMNISHPTLQTAKLQLDASETQGGNRDVVVNYSLQGNEIESGMMLYNGGDENFYLLMVQPPKKVLKDDILPREYIFIVDVSGSMHGYPLDVSKKLLRNLITNLRPTDKFNVILFSGTSGTLSPVSVNATQENVERALKFIDAQQGGGGTELLPALKEAYAIPRPDPELTRSFVIVTDGYVDVEREAYQFIRENSGNINFFSFGIGSGVNRYIIEGMAFAGNGEPMVITKKDEAEKQAEKFRNYINSPLLSRIKVNYGGLQVYDVEPSSSPDMLAERPIIITGKYKGKPSGTITVTGKAGKKNYKQTFDLSQVKPNADYAAIRYLWARERIKLFDYYSDDKYGNSSENEYAKKITQLGLKYNLMTNYTSFVAIDEQETIGKDGKPVTVKQALPLPENVSDYAVGYDAGAPYAASGYPVMANMLNRELYEKFKGVEFELNRADIRPQSAPFLDNAAQIILGYGEGRKFIVEGHTDSRGTDEYNLKLSQRRVESIVKYLEAKGVSKGQLIPVGKGWEGAKWPECKPAAVCEEWKNEQNRRVVFRLVDDSGEAKSSLYDQETQQLSDVSEEAIELVPSEAANNANAVDNTVYTTAEQMPVFPYGDVNEYVKQHIDTAAIQGANVEGQLGVQFIVEKDGSISNVEIVKSLDSSLDKEVIRVVQNMPKWNPGKQKGTAVRVRYTLPIDFKLTK